MSRIDYGKSSPWTKEKTDKLKVLVASGRGYSCSEMARMIGGVSRNSVIGKINRLKLKAPRSQGDHSHNTPRIKPFVPRIVPKEQPLTEKSSDGTLTVPIPVLDSDGLPYTIATIGHNMCRYPYNDPLKSNHYYCAAPTSGHTMWCAYHREKLFTPALSRP
jgi:GcrA cell cycle regulator